MEQERRVVEIPVEARAESDGNERRLTGYAALYNTETRIASLFREVIEVGAFRSALSRGDDVRALFNHDAGVVLGRTRSGTLTLSEDERGLRYDVLLPDTQQARDLWTLVQRGDVTQSSFACTGEADGWRDQDAELPLRVVNDVRLYDVSPVTYPAYAETSVSARSTVRLEEARRAAAQGWRAQIATCRAALAQVDAWRRR